MSKKEIFDFLFIERTITTSSSGYKWVTTPKHMVRSSFQFGIELSPNSPLWQTNQTWVN